MLDRDFRLSSNWRYFSEECDGLKLVFSRLKYPDNLVNSLFHGLLPPKHPIKLFPYLLSSDRSDPVRVVFAFKDQVSADIVVGAQLKDLSEKLQTTVQPVFVSQKIGRDLKLPKPPCIQI